ncbi:lactonase family protein [Paenibacillus illinoisensis]|uniref:lactonase family protein n=1 Tax=Paenibacillus TaxID=44249 RepID=UPI001C8DC5B0|nr:lactonase family protein [Paenibacillus illinoisensis]MBY0215728.1 lactonase family protein [Paenibacillus illinoisensis]MCM3207281.1 lactonase family protein [Paenibacillus illinoisensis]
MERTAANETFFYTGTYASADQPGIVLCALDADTGEMRIVSHTEGVDNPSYLALCPDANCLYAASETDEGEVLVYRRDTATSELHLMDRKLTKGASPCYVSVTKDGKWVLTSNYSSGSVNVFPVGDQGTLEEMSALVEHTGRGKNDDRQEGPHAHSIQPDPSGQYAVVCDLGLDQIIVYRMEEGRLVTHRETNQPPGSGPRHLVFHPSGKWAYVINELNNTVTAFMYDERRGEFNTLQHISTLPEGHSGEGTAADIRVSPCGRFLYASNRGHDSIVLYHIDQESGKLEAVEWTSTIGQTPRNFNLLPGGILLVANQDSNNIVAFQMDGEDGRLTHNGFKLEVSHPVCITPVV